jgi:hypothetical protein
MATWRAEVFVNSRVGRINTEVEAASFQGAKEQIYAKHGNVQQIVNLREVRGGGGGGSSSVSIGDIGGSIGTIAFLILLFAIIEYWKYFVIGGAIFLILAIIYYLVKDRV